MAGFDTAFPNWVNAPGSPSVPGSSDLNRIQDNLMWLYDPPRCSLVISSNTLSIPSGVDTTLTWQKGGQGTWDHPGNGLTANLFDATSDSASVVIPVTGTYVISPVVDWDQNATGVRRLTVSRIRSGTATVLRQDEVASSGGNRDTIQSLSLDAPLNAGDLIQVSVFQDSTASINVTQGAYFRSTQLQVRYVCGPS